MVIRGRGRPLVRKKPIVPGRRESSKRPRGLVQRWQIEDALAGFEPTGDTMSMRNHQRRLHVASFLKTQTDTAETDIQAILEDLPSYIGWESDNKFRQV